MPQAGVVFRAGLILLLSAFLAAAQLSVAWGQASPEAAVFVDRAVLAYDEKKFDEALKELQEALRIDPENVDALYYQGLAYAALNRAADAQASLEKARELRPTDVDVAFQLSVIYFNQQGYEKAEPLLRQVYQAEPQRQNLGYYLGFIEYRKKNYREALTLLRGNVPSDESFAQLARFYAGLGMGALGFAREARAEIEEALRLQPVSPLTVPAQRFGEVLERAAQREKFFRGDLRLGVYYDTNVPVVPVASNDVTARTIRESTRRQKSQGQLASLNLAYTWLKTVDWEGTISHRFLQTYNDHLLEFNTQSNTPTVGVLYRSTMSDMPAITGLQYSYDLIRLAHKRFTQRYIINPYFTLVEDASNLTTLQFRLQNKDFFNDRQVIQGAPVGRSEVRGGWNYMVGPLHYFLFEEGRHNIKLGYQFDYEDADGKNWTYRGSRLLFGFQYTLPWWDIRFRHDLDFHWRFHQSKNTLNPADATDTVHRRDREPLNLISLSKDFFEDFTIALEYLYDINKSNLGVYEYYRHVITTSLTWRFDSSAFGF